MKHKIFITAASSLTAAAMAVSAGAEGLGAVITSVNINNGIVQSMTVNKTDTADAVAVAAVYDANGRLTKIATQPVSETGEKVLNFDGTLTVDEGETVKGFLWKANGGNNMIEPISEAFKVGANAETTNPEATEEAKEITSPEATEAAKETNAPEATEEAKETTSPEATETAKETTSPEATEEAKETTSPEATEAAKETTKPEATEEAKETTSPEATEEAKETTKPEETSEPDATAAPTLAPLDEGVISAFRYMNETSLSGYNTEGETRAYITASEDGTTSTKLSLNNTDYTDPEYGIIRDAAVLSPVTSWGENAYVQVELSTLGYDDIAVSAKIGATKKGPANYTIRYSTDGTEFKNITGYDYTLEANKTLYQAFDKIALPEDAENAEKLYIRICPADMTTLSGGSLSGKSGEYAVNDILVYGTANGEATPEPEETTEPEGDGIIHLMGDSINADGVAGATVDGNVVTLSDAGEYTVEGTLNDGQIIVSAPSKSSEITVNLDGVNVTSTTADAFSAEQGVVTIATASGTENTFTAKADSANAIYSKNDLILKGEGTLNAVSELGNGIRSKADLEIGAGDVNVTAYNNGIKGDDSVKITKKATNIKVTAQTGDAVKSDAISSKTNDLEYGKGTVTINGGTLELTATAGDGIQADAEAIIANSPKLTINAGGNGIKANSAEIASYDENGNSTTINGAITIKGGTVDITSTEEALRAAETLDVSGGTVTVTVNGDTQDGIKAGKNEDTVSGSTTTTTVTVPGVVNISGGTVEIKSATDDGIVSMGKVNITGGTVKGSVSADFFKVYDEFNMSDGELDITSGCDGIQSGKALTETTSGNNVTESNYTQGDVNISGGKINITANGGSQKRSHTSVQSISNSCKGIKANTYLNISGGDITVNSCDDAIHSNWTVTITGGTMALASDDDGVHADYMLTLGAESGADDDFTIDISYSYEGIEASVINVLSGTTYLYSTDDGVNAAGDYQEGATLSEVSENASLMAGPGGSFGGWNNNGGSGNSSPGWGSDDSSDHGMLYIKGGRLYCEVNGDGLDSNGSIAMSGGTVIVNGPTSGGNGVFDKGDNNSDTFTLTGGTLIGVGISDMNVYPTVSGQGYYSGTTSSSSGGWGGWGGQSGSSSSTSVTKGTPIKLTTDNGYVVVIPKVTASSGFIYISTPDMTSGKSYSLSSDTSYSDGEQVFGKTENGTFYGLIEKKN